jgi:hypothetical protein
VGHVVSIGELRNAHRNLVGKPVERRPVRKPTSWWEDNIKIGLRGICFELWIAFIWPRLGTSGVFM